MTIERAKSIRIRIEEGSFQTQIRALDNKPTPLAETIWIQSLRSPLDLRQCNLFQGQLPSLRALVTHCCDFPWGDTLLRSSLRVLSVTGVTPANRPSMNALLDTLSQLVNLEELVFIHSLPMPRQHIHFVPASQRVRLDRLRLFRIISSSPVSLGAFAASILVPTTAIYDVECQNMHEPQGPHDFHDAILLGESIIHHFELDENTRRDGMPSFVDFISLDGDPGRDGGGSCSLWLGAVRSTHAEGENADAPIDILQSHVMSLVTLRLRWISRENLPMPSAEFRQQVSHLAILHAIRAMPLSTIRGVAAVGAVMRPPAMWEIAFERARAVTLISASGPSAYGAIESCILGAAGTTAILQENPTLFPALKSMHLSHVNVNQPGLNGVPGPVYDYLRILLRTRRDSVREDGTAKTLARLGVKGVDLTGAQVEQLGSLLSSGQVEVE